MKEGKKEESPSCVGPWKLHPKTSVNIPLTPAFKKG